jgi:hypothetical protein
MIASVRKLYNDNFSDKKYQLFLSEIINTHNYIPKFKIAETPIFIPKELKHKLIQACDEVIAVINQPNFKELTNAAFFDKKTIVPNEDEKAKFIQLDFGICKDLEGNIVPKLIELQGFPSLYFFQELLGRMYKKHFGNVIPDNFTQYVHDFNTTKYIALLKQEIVGKTDPKQIILLEIEPEKQATAVDFYATEKALGIKVLCISNLKKKEKELFYIDDKGIEIKILKIYNRIIFDELHQRDDLKREFDFLDEVDIEWIGHPNWFYRISKFTMPLLKGNFIPNSEYLNTLKEIPSDLENYVLKPLYSFAGAGVQIHVTKEMIDAIDNKSNYLLQEKVIYEPIITTLDVPAKCEVRMMLLLNSTTNQYEIVSNLVRLSKGEMVGVKYNKDKTWVGGSTGFFES